jgi:ABC-2 type transport system ATP-binding protein
LTVYENLKYLDILFQLGENRIAEVISLVDLSNARNKKAKKLSSGMKQRLGIALALFHNPDMLILDEPLNGLDPEGVHGMRKLIVKLHQEGKTILLSSHILSEIQKVCTHIGIIDDGRLIYQGSIHSLLSNINQRVTVETSNASKAKVVCLEKGFEVTDDTEDRLTVLIPNKHEYSRLIHVLSSSRIDIFSIKSDELDLESIFLTLTSHQTK